MKWIVILLCFLLSSCAHRGGWERASSARQGQKQSPVIILDPGHGGTSPGTKRNAAPVIVEKNLTLECALKVRDYLQKRGYIVRLTRTKDEDVSLHKRVDLAHQWGGTFFVSIHFNHAPNPRAHGIEIFYYNKSQGSPLTTQSKKLATTILDSVVAGTKAKSRGVREGDYCVLRENRLPAVLIEGGFFSNAAEAKKLATPRYIDSLAQSIAEGIDRFVCS
ncbi:MAG: N-acetylmuramoyl-L-alanine amidase [Verrucomicrobia bacterium]|nr:N-acetylmuramoyl-L-alanine amidase [Verrucomicrobiota bacterium]